MDHFKALYKINGATLSPNISKRKVANEIRANKRNQLYSSTRDLSPSPSRREYSENTEEQKENLKPISSPNNNAEAQSDATSSIQAKNIKTEGATGKQSRNKDYLMRYLKWKAERVKESRLKKEAVKRAPFVVPGKSTAGYSQSQTVKQSFAPKNHTFVPPANLKDITFEPVSSNTFRCHSGAQQCLFQVVDTPKKPSAVSKFTSKATFSRPPSSLLKFTPKPIPNKLPSTTVLGSRTGTAVKKLSPSAVVETKTETSAKRKAFPEKTPKANPSVNSKLSSTVPQRINTVRSEVKPKKTPIRPPPIKPPPIKPPPIKLPPKTAEKTKMAPKVVAAAKMPPPHRPPQKILKKSHETRSTAATSKTGTIKSGLPPLKRPTFKAPKKTSSSISKAFEAVKKTKFDSLAPVSNIVPETPTELSSSDSLLKFVTSTRRKSSSLKDQKTDPLFNELEDTISPIESGATTVKGSAKKPESDKKFDFIRYSVIENDKVSSPEETKTPIKTEENEEKPTNYMSPYVSVSRGKVSVKAERDKRNSVYMTPENKDTNVSTYLSRTLATVRYYRKQLAEVIARLNEQCALWEKYKQENATLIEDGGVDMINVTIGQTNLLTTKKLKQFGSLIDRCENGALGKKAENAGDGEGAKSILPEDLEGFWSMVGLQIENIDKRFANLERWKANNWNDPDDIPSKSAQMNGANPKRKRKPVAAAARPTGSLLKMLKAAHASYVNKKATNDLDEDVILTPSKRQIVIKDRRSRSAAATVITVNVQSPANKSMTSVGREANQTPTITPHVSHFRKSMNLLKTALIKEHELNSPKADRVIAQTPSARQYKPILKTPASVRKQKSVGFTTEVIEAISPPNDMEEDKRTYKLRNRRIILRDSSEFVIPK